MEKIRIHECDSGSLSQRPGIDQQKLSDFLGIENVEVNYYHIGPHERLSGLHAHLDQEEIFIPIEGKVTFETMDGEVGVRVGEVISFSPGEYQSAKNNSAKEAIVLALGAPRESENIRIPYPCPECPSENLQPSVDENNSEILACTNCGTRMEITCSVCNGRNIILAYSEGMRTPTNVCLDCGTQLDD